MMKTLEHIRKKQDGLNIYHKSRSCWRISKLGVLYQTHSAPIAVCGMSKGTFTHSVECQKVQGAKKPVQLQSNVKAFFTYSVMKLQ